MQRSSIKVYPLLATLPFAMPATIAFGAGAELSKLRFAQSGHTSSSWPIYVAEQKKIFEKNSIEVENIIIRAQPILPAPYSAKPFLSGESIRIT